MDRLAFLKTCGMACLGVAYGVTFLEGCVGTKIVDAPLQESDLVVPLNEFEVVRKQGMEYRKAIVVQNAELQYPICVFRHSNTEYTALLMRCTHLGAELQVFGDRLQCPAHGSEFDSQGTVQQGPANNPLRKFPATIDQHQLRISLK